MPTQNTRDLSSRILLASNYATQVLADSPIRYYRLGETSGTVAIDNGSQKQNGTYTSVTLAQTSLISTDTRNTSVLFNGTTSKVAIPTTSLPTGTGNWTMEAWVKTPVSLPTGTFPTVMMFGTNNTNQQASLGYQVSSNHFALGNWATNTILSAKTVTTSTVYHLVATYNGTTAIFYINGASVGSVTFAYNITASLADIGTDTAAGDLWTGTIDEVAWYGSVLSPTRITAHYLAGVGKDIPIRALVAAQDIFSLSTRVKIAASKSRDLTIRLLLTSANQVQKNLAARVRVMVANVPHDLASRMRVMVANVPHNLSARIRVMVVNVPHDLTIRIRTMVPNVPHDLALRTRISSGATFHMVATRLLVSRLSTRDLTVRFIVNPILTRIKDTSIRIIVFFPTPGFAPVVPLPFYQGTGGMLPLSGSFSGYSVNGVVIDTPVVCTTPFCNSVLVPTGSAFLLTFANPSTLTQSLLTGSSTVTMTFALYSGEPVTGPVSIQILSQSGPWLVLFTAIAPIQVMRWVVQSQFP